MLRCPVCHSPLKREEKQLRCTEGHCFDLSASGYVHLLLPSKRHSVHPGDSREMIRSRQDFLERGYYAFLQKRLTEILQSLLQGKTHPVIADVGCGQGYYTGAFAAALKELSSHGESYGFDLAKDALRSAAKRDPNTLYAVASLADLPLFDESLDLLIDIFAPYNSAEFFRVLKKNGRLLTAVPAQEHLFGLKSVLYENPYRNVLAPYEMEGFSVERVERIRRRVTIAPNADILNLFRMTPYYWKTSKEAASRLSALSTLETELDFGIILYSKK